MFKSKPLVALVLTLSMLLSISAPAFANSEVPYETIGVTRQEFDGNIIYFGAPGPVFDENDKVYAFPILRSGDVSQEASVVLRTIDFSALYNKDYSIIGDSIEIIERDKTLIELAITGEKSIIDDSALNEIEEGSQQIGEIIEENSDVLTDDDPDSPDAEVEEETADESKEYFAVVPEIEVEETSGKSKLALEKEAQTGKLTREVQKTEVYNELGDIVRDELLGDIFEHINYSSETVLTFAPGEEVKYVNIRIMDDGISEGEEYFTFLMTEPQGAELSEMTATNVIITDDEPVVLPKITFSSDEYKSKDGIVSVTVKRNGAEYSPATCILETTDGSAIADVHYESIYGEIVFAPYEKEKTVDIIVGGKGDFKLTLSDFTGCEAGALSQATAKIDEGAGIALFAAANDGLEFPITVKDKTYTVKYKSGDIVGEIYDTGYDPHLLVGKYYFSAPDSEGGIFNYNRDNKTGTLPSNKGNYNSFYSGPSTTGDFATGNGQLEYYHSYTKRTGSMYTYSNANADTKIEGPYYQYLIPHWEQDRTFGNVFVSDSQLSSMDVYDRALNKKKLEQGLIGTGVRTGKFSKETSMDSAVQIKDVLTAMCVKVAAVDKYTGRTPKIRTKFYGVAAFYKKYRISVTYPTEKQFITGVNSETGEAVTTGYIPAQVNVNCGAQILGNRENMDIFINDDEKKSNLVFSVSDNRVNGVNGKFGKITGYTIRIGSSSAYINKSYPADYFSFLDSKVKANASTTSLSFTSAAVESVKKKVNSNLDTIPIDKYFSAWIESVQKEKNSQDKTPGVISDGGKAYHQELKFTPIVDYYDVDVTVVKPYTEGTDMNVVLGGFKWQELSLGEHRFHAGDSLDLTGEPYDSSYKAEGYEVSVNDGVFNTIRDTKTLVLLPGNKYTIRPVISQINNCIEITRSEGAMKYFEIGNNVFTEEELAPYPEFAGKTILKLHPEKKTVLEQMTPEVGKIYYLDVIWKDNRSNKSFTYFPYITDKMTGNKYITNRYYFKARSLPGDNVINLAAYQAKAANVGKYKIKGSVKTSYKPILSNGLEFSKEGAQGYSVIMGSGERESEQTSVNGVKETVTIVDTVNDITDENGNFEFDAIQGFKNVYINLLVTNGTNTEDIINVKLPAKGTNGKVITVGAEEFCLQYSPNLPYIPEGGISYYYDKSTNNEQIDLRENSIRVFDDNLTIRAVVNSNGRKIKKAVFKIRTTNGIESSYDAYPEMTGSNVYSCKIDALPENAYNGDRVSVYLVDEETIDGTEASEAIVYPKVDTGIVFYVENAVIAPKEYSFDDITTVDVPLIGKASPTVNSGLLKIEKTKWEDGTGLTFAVNAAGSWTNSPPMTSKQKLEGYKKFREGVKTAHTTNVREKLSKVDYDNSLVTFNQLTRMLNDKDYKKNFSQIESYINDITTVSDDYKRIHTEYSKQAKDAATAFDKTFCTINATICFALDYILNPETQEFKHYRTSFALGGTATTVSTKYSLLGSVPTFLNLTVTIQGNITNSWTKDRMLSSTDFESYSGNIRSLIEDDEKGDNPDDVFDWKFLLDMVIKGKLQAGAGMNGVFSTRGFVDLGLQFELGARNGLLWTAGGGIGFDLFFGSIDINIAKITQGTGSLKNAIHVSFFNEKINVPLSLRSAARDTTVSNNDGTSTSDYGAGTDDMDTFGMKMLRGMPEAVNMQPLLNDAADRTRPQILDLGDGRKFVVFIANRGTDSEITANDMCLFYSICDENGNWAEPVPVADDGTFDTMPDIVFGTNKKNIGIVWADSARELTSEDSLKDKLNTLGISGAIYNLESGTMSDEINFVSDEYFNLAPQVSMVDDKIYVSYMARDIESVTKDEDILDVTGLYSTMVTVGYDMTAKEVIPKDFVDIKHPAIDDPLTMDYNTLTSKIGDKTYTLATYTVDTDGKIDTASDRELYLSIEDVKKEKAYYPIKISSGVTVSVPRLTKLGDEIFLSWLKDTREIQLLDVSDLVSALFMNDAIGDVYADSDEDDATWYKKTAKELRMHTEESFSPTTGSDYHGYLVYDDSIYNDLYNGTFRISGTSITTSETDNLSIEEYKLVSNGNDIYIFFTRMNEAPDKTGMELYGIRYKRHIGEEDDSLGTDVNAEADANVGEWGFSDAVAITDYDAVIDEFDMFMTEDNKISLVSNFYRQSINDDGVVEYTPNKLVEIDFEPMGSANIKYNDIAIRGNTVPGSIVNIGFDVENRGLYTLKDYHLKVVAEKNGAEEVLFEDTVSTHLDANESEPYNISWTVPENVDGTTIKVTVSEASGVVQARPQTVECELSGAPHVTMDSLEFELEDDGQLIVSTTATNSGNTASTETDVNICDENDNVIATAKLKALNPGETVDIAASIELKNEYFGDLGVMSVKATADFGEDNTVTASGDYIPLKPVVAEINDGKEAFDLTAGKTSTLTSVAAPWNSLAGQVTYSSADDEVATVDENGVVTGVGVGSTQITAYYTESGISDVINVNVLSSGSSGGSSGSSISTKTEKNEDGSTTKTTTDKKTGTVTEVTTYPDGDVVTVKTEKDGTVTAEVKANFEKDVVLPIESTEDIIVVSFTDENGRTRYTDEFTESDEGIAVTANGNVKISVIQSERALYTDVHNNNHWAAKSVDFVGALGIMKGIGDDKFAPDSHLTRAMLVTMLYRADGEPEVETVNSFGDIKENAWYEKAVLWAKENGIVNGVTETEFSPDSDITREQIATIMHRYAKYKGDDVESGKNTNILSYNDSDSISDYAKASLQWANGIGLINGKTESTLNPLDNATRAEAATIFYRFVKANLISTQN